MATTRNFEIVKAFPPARPQVTQRARLATFSSRFGNLRYGRLSLARLNACTLFGLAAAAMVCVLPLVAAQTVSAQSRITENLSGPGWKLWLDTNAVWQNDPLFLPPVNVAKLPINPPTGGWSVLDTNGCDVSVPGTVEEYLQPGDGPKTDIKGVSWWTRSIKIPDSASPRRLLLRFEAVRLRAEVYLNHKLVGYDLVGNSPFTVDISHATKPGQTCQLAVRVTDPGGNFIWRDSAPFRWGTNLIPMSHGFGGITGPLRLVSCDPVYVGDIYVQNTPAITNVNVLVTVRNSTARAVQRDIRFAVAPKGDAAEPPVYVTELRNVALHPGTNEVRCPISVAHAKLWDLQHPNLYTCALSLSLGGTVRDQARQTFGFRWFAPVGIGSNAEFQLNGKRIVLRTAISWGFWPINGIFPTPRMAKKEILDAKALGLNMLNFHRCIGQPEVLDDADRLGLLFYEEPGAYVNGDKSPFAKALARAKLFRMVKRDRSHPSLIIYNMINEAWDSGGASHNKAVFEGHVRDMRHAHALDPSRISTHTSAWAQKVGDKEMAKMQMRPFDNTVHMSGWYDYHHAGGPPVWNQGLYRSPHRYYNRTTDRKEIVYWGEEGAISTPPRLALIKRALDHSPHIGWDGQIYLDWYRRFNDFLTRKNLRSAFSAVDALTKAMGAVSYYHQGRKIELMRLNNITDGYAINGWESETVENHSGIVDCFRNLKADPAIMAYYNRPLYVAVMSRSQFAEVPGRVTVDFYIINEKDIQGPCTLVVSVRNPAGKQVYVTRFPVQVKGGDVYGQLLKSGVRVPIAGATGMFRIEAQLLDASGRAVTTGHDQVLAVNWRNQTLPGKGATWENHSYVRDFLRKQKHLSVPAYRDGLARLDWVAVTRPPNEGEEVVVPADAFQSGLRATFYTDHQYRHRAYQRTDKHIDFYVPDGATPDSHSSLAKSYGVRWEGKLMPPRSGSYTLAIKSNDGVRLWVNGQALIDDPGHAHVINRGHIRLQAGQPASVRLEFWHRKRAAQCRLLWAVPETNPPSAAGLIQRVKTQGTTLIILDRADTWMPLIEKNTAIRYNGSFTIGTAWLGGLFFVRANPLFRGLPVNTAMNWPYQAVVRDGRRRTGMRLEGEQLVAGAWHCYPMDLGTAVGIIPCGKGKIIVSTLDIADQLGSRNTSASVARKLLCNFIAYHVQGTNHEQAGVN